MIDIHSHIIPNVDDGSEGIAESLKMLRVAQNNDVAQIIATPHSYGIDRITKDHGKHIRSEVEKLNDAAEKNGIPVKLYPGEEIIYEPDTVSGLKSGKYTTLCGSRYPLIEFMPDEHTGEMILLVDSLVKEGYIPIIAHPERYDCIQYDTMNAYALKDHGALLQVNSQSIFGLFGRGSARAARHLIFGMAADFIASDSHSPYVRSAELAEIHEVVSEEVDFKYANILLQDNPQKVIDNEEIFAIRSVRK